MTLPLALPDRVSLQGIGGNHSLARTPPRVANLALGQHVAAGIAEHERATEMPVVLHRHEDAPPHVLRAFFSRDRDQEARRGSPLARARYMAIAPFPHEYSVTLRENTLSAVDASVIVIGPPRQFGGTDDTWSPEHLLVGAIVSCFKTTFDAYCRRDKLAVLGFETKATALLAKSPEGPVFQAIELDVEIVSDDESRALSLVRTAERNCIISRALSAPVRVTARVRSPRPQPLHEAAQLPEAPGLPTGTV